MEDTKKIFSGHIIISVVVSSILMTSFMILSLNQMGLIAFTNVWWLVNACSLTAKYLGSSIIFFALTFFGYCYLFSLTKSSLNQYDSTPSSVLIDRIRFYNGGIDLFISIFFAIGVLYTAWGLQNSLVIALGGVSKIAASQMGAWGILKRLVDNGILIALWTTIVGGAGAFIMRLIKYFFLGKDLARFQNKSLNELITTLESIRVYAENIEKKLNMIFGEE